MCELAAFYCVSLCDSAPTWLPVCPLCNSGSSSAAMPPPLPAALGLCSLAGVALIWRDISSKMRGENRTAGGLLGQYVAVKGVGWLGRRQRRKLEEDTLNVRRVQEETLLKRLRKNANTRYGKRFDFSSVTGEDEISRRPCGAGSLHELRKRDTDSPSGLL